MTRSLTLIAHPTLPTCSFTSVCLTGELKIRTVIEGLELKLGPKKGMHESLNRRETWLDVFANDPELEEQVRAVSGAKDTKGAVRVIQNLYQQLSHEIHNPKGVDVPIPLETLSFTSAALAMVLCRRLPVLYRLLSPRGKELSRSLTPEQVARGDIGVVEEEDEEEDEVGVDEEETP
jgi:hypothetical protein